MKNEQLHAAIKEILDPINGRYSVAVDWGEEKLALHSEEKCEAASLIKIPILLESFRQHESGQIDLGDWVEVPDSKKVGGAGVLNHLSPDLKLTIKDLLTLMIVVSDNTAANLVLDLIGKDSVNRLCKQLGCGQTSLQRALLDQNAIKHGQNNYTSAHDMMICLREMIYGSLLNEQSRHAILEMMKVQQLANKFPQQIIQYDAGDPVIAHKTGEVRGVEHDIGIIRQHNQEVLFAVLTYDLDDNAEGRRAIAAVGKVIVDAMV